VLALVALGFSTGCAASSQHVVSGELLRTSGDHMRQLEVDGRERSYVVHVPPAYERQRRHALVMALHGHGGTPQNIMAVSGLSKKADQAGFLVVYPQGTGWLGLHPRGWNAGQCCGYPVEKQVDDVGFLRAVIADVQQLYSVDPKRVYVTGASNGGMMAYRLACELSDQIAAIAPVAGAPGDSSCAPSDPVSVVIFHGTADQYVPYDGGVGRASRGKQIAPPVASAVSLFVERNGCMPVPQRRERGAIREEIYTQCRGGAEVALYSITNGGHAWPGGDRGWRFGAVPTRELSATDRMWEFFVRHPKP
jgi:polyhydroxybutyrate depolymerase